MFRPRRRDRRPRPRRKEEEEEEEEEPKARLDFFVSPLPDLEDIFTEVFTRKEKNGRHSFPSESSSWMDLSLSLSLSASGERARAPMFDDKCF